MTLASGARFGLYVVLGPLGHGGMGEVYRARDTRLQRDVALKVLRGGAAEVPQRVRRFQHEAQAASSLNHPNIVVLYEVGEAAPGEGQPPVPFIAMELVDGDTLDARVGHGLNLRGVLDLVTQVADGLARAHESGIVHRDLKPSNILATSDGLVKIVDFGLAKLHQSAESLSEAATRDDLETSPGMLLGTPAYMSPEQARGEDATAASDQFAFGCILYEMLTGRRAFAAGSVAETISAVLRDEPRPIAELRPGVPAPLRWIVERCLAKEPRDRYASTRDLARDLRALRDHIGELGGPAGAPALTPPRGRLLVRALGGVLAAAIALLLWTTLRDAPQPEFRRLTFQEGVVSRGLFVPRSNSVLYSASWQGGPARTFTMLPEASGLDRALESEAQIPMAFSEDGSEVLVLLVKAYRGISARGTLAAWPAVGGRTRPIVDEAGWADWTAGGRIIVYVRDHGAEQVLVCREGGAERVLFRTTGALTYARLSPDRAEVAFIHHASRGDDAGEVRLIRLDGSGPAQPLTPVYERCLGLDWNLRTKEIWFTAARAPHGTSLLAVDRGGRGRVLYALPESAALESVSQDGNRFLLTLRDESMALSVRRGREPARDLTWLGMSVVADVSPDGRTVLFWDGGASERASGSWLRPVDGGDAVRLGEGDPKRFSPDGRSVVAVTRPPSGATRFLLIPVGAGASRALRPPDADSGSPSFAGTDSLLFVRRVAGRKEVWSMPTDGTGTGRTLGASGCDLPLASPSGSHFLAVCGTDASALEIHSMTKPEGRRLFELPAGDEFVYARWNGSGDRVLAVTTLRRFLTLDASRGTVLAEEELPPLERTDGDLVTAALSADGSVQAYSADRISSRLYIAEGIR
jgi:hypothetical protein